jgi:hypothetical protein
MRSTFSIALILLLAISIPLSTSVSASGQTELSTPEFTITTVNHTSDTPTTYSTDPYTGETITNPSVHYEWQTLDFKIKNQPYTRDDSEKELMYSIRHKGHFSNDWETVTRIMIQNYTSDFTEISFVLNGWSGQVATSGTSLHFPNNSLVDFQVKAVIGYPNTSPVLGFFFDFIVEEGSWSNIHTVNFTDGTETVIPNTSVSPPPTNSPLPTPTLDTQPSQNPTATSTQPVTQDKVLFGLEWKDIAIAWLVVVVAGLALALVWSRIKKR